ncbi:HEAT repeat domain-containing protein [Sphingomonas sp. MMS24-J13]|uniref:HEAT repeat domain-containing protein n=1 Tax=Sphingomonas sp. MMS24-J13 TaxID=3238686 RepID=UPI00384EFDCB
MSEDYYPASDFLNAIIGGDVALTGNAFADENLRHLIRMTKDDEPTNRDWATLLLSQQEVDTPEVREALLNALSDPEEIVRAEALLGLAQRDTKLALPYAISALSSDCVSVPVFEAAALIADAALVEHVRPWAEASGDAWIDKLAQEALQACVSGIPKP